MNKKLSLALQIIGTLLIAALVSSAIGFILAFILGNLGLYYKSFNIINSATSILYGLLVGYKLNNVIRDYRSK